eukprot:RCo008900
MSVVMAEADSAPPLLGSYAIVGTLARTRRSVVYHVVRQSDGKKFAAKVPFDPTDSLTALEYDSLRRIWSRSAGPCVVKPEELFYLDTGGPAVVMQLMDETLAGFLQQKPGHCLAEWSELLHIFTGLVSAVHHLHQMRVVHGGLTPRHVLLAGSQVLVCSLSTAAEVGDRPDPTLVRPSLAEEDLAFFPPEALTAPPELAFADFSVDIYAVGAMMLLAALGTTAATPTTPEQLGMELGDRGMPAALAEVILKCVAPTPAKRYKSAYGLLQALKRCQVSHQDESVGFGAFSLPPKLFGFETLITQLQSDVFASDGFAYVSIQGEPGTGKTSLVNAVRENFRREGLRTAQCIVACGSCVPGPSARPYRVWRTHSRSWSTWCTVIWRRAIWWSCARSCLPWSTFLLWWTPSRPWRCCWARTSPQSSRRHRRGGGGCGFPWRPYWTSSRISSCGPCSSSTRCSTWTRRPSRSCSSCTSRTSASRWLGLSPGATPRPTPLPSSPCSPTPPPWASPRSRSPGPHTAPASCQSPRPALEVVRFCPPRCLPPHPWQRPGSVPLW